MTRRMALDHIALSRRTVMIGAAGLTFGFVGHNRSPSIVSLASAASPVEMNPWVTIAQDGMISIMSPSAEMGQGSKTSLPLILAEELDADWKDVRIVAAPPSDVLYGNPGFLGMMYTAGSTAVAGYYTQLRQFGAQVRRVLLDNVAQRWNVPVHELTTGPSVVIHQKTGRSLSYGDVAKFAVVPSAAPKIIPDDLKQPDRFRLIGKDVMRFELPSKIDGSARYSIDVQVAGMLYGTLLCPALPDSRPETIKDTAARGIPGVIGVYNLPIGVGVVAETSWAAFAAKDVLEVTWTKSARAPSFDSEAALNNYAAVARGDVVQKATLWDTVGEGADGIKAAATVLKGEFRCDYAYHAQMEPLNAVAAVSADGKSVEIWCGTQSQTMAVTTAATALGIEKENVKFNETLLGGGFGRRGPRDQDFLLGALFLSKQVKRPVKVLWTREDDIRNGRFRPMSAHHIEAGFDASSKLMSWHHRVATDNVGVFQDPVRYFGPWKERDIISLSGTELPTYAIRNRLAEHFAMHSGVRVSALRGIGFTANKFATEAFIDEAARKHAVDPLEFRRELTKDAPRARAVIETVGKMSGWGQKRSNNALGIAYIDYAGTQIAGVGEVSLDRATGVIKLMKFWVAIDPGVAVQPNNIVAQIEGSVIYGMGLALSERITIKDGEIEQSNFYDYTVMRMRDMPDIQIKILSTQNKPTGVGQMATPLVAPAISNAIAELTGVRLRHTPMLPERVLASLKGNDGN
ncbi:xanthine dehydrogenase family protein molybdopterin-binding subunit [Bradyrhizobium diazoefficiens]|nr:molybdopterin cofactor-binding domain-containing protein [Bradyrhizobium diazoefficiens]QQN62305.1 xanthine dehydrogenase family protein molybdopterin-binding subunit [Bradyrhizobium diazoefficiens]